MIASYAVLNQAFHLLGVSPVPPALPAVLGGGFLFGAFFMATDPVTSPMTSMGKWMYGLLIGISTALIRNLTGYVEGVMFSILLGNIFAPVLDEIAIVAHVRRLREAG